MQNLGKDGQIKAASERKKNAVPSELHKGDINYPPYVVQEQQAMKARNS
jgi:hypothetical protein